MDAAREAGLNIFIQTVVTKQRLHSEEFIKFLKYFNGKGIGVFVTYAKPVGAWENDFSGLVDKKDMLYMKKLEKKIIVVTGGGRLFRTHAADAAPVRYFCGLPYYQRDIINLVALSNAAPAGRAGT